jgi:response regulator RpfG family c-di-GMP phosphodiesterase
MYAPEYPSAAPADEPIDVIVLIAPSPSTSRDQFLRTIAELKSDGRTAVVVVFPHFADTETLARVSTAGADLCVVAPTSHDLFACMERARSLHRLASRDGSASTRRQNCRRNDELLDTLWKKRSHRESS